MKTLTTNVTKCLDTEQTVTKWWHDIELWPCVVTMCGLLSPRFSLKNLSFQRWYELLASRTWLTLRNLSSQIDLGTYVFPVDLCLHLRTYISTMTLNNLPFRYLSTYISTILRTYVFSCFENFCLKLPSTTSTYIPTQ